MEPTYEKVIVKRDLEGKVEIVVITDLKNHSPIFYKTDKMGMDDVLEFLK